MIILFPYFSHQMLPYWRDIFHNHLPSPLSCPPPCLTLKRWGGGGGAGGDLVLNQIPQNAISKIHEFMFALEVVGNPR